MKIGVIIKTHDGLWSVTRFLDSDTARIFIRMCSIQLSDQIKSIDIVQLDPCNPIQPPEGFEPTYTNFKDHKYWCPWCGELRYFGTSPEYRDYRFCSTCHISDADYHIRRFNKLDSRSGMPSVKATGGGEKLNRKIRKQKRREKLAKRIVIDEENE